MTTVDPIRAIKTITILFRPVRIRTLRSQMGRRIPTKAAGNNHGTIFGEKDLKMDPTAILASVVATVVAQVVDIRHVMGQTNLLILYKRSEEFLTGLEGSVIRLDISVQTLD